MDYAHFYRRSISLDRVSKEVGSYDVFISAYNSSDRVRKIFDEVKADRKIWLVHPEYQYADVEVLVDGGFVRPLATDEIAQVDALLAESGPIAGASLCIDITGFMRHVLAFLVPKLAYVGVKRFTALYSEPLSYTNQEETVFTTTTSGVVRPVRGMFGSPGPGRDHLLVAVGYDHKLISEVSSYKDGVSIHPLFAFPSLSADMYQQSALRAEKSGEVVLRPEWVANRIFAPANDPFSTASVISDRVASIDAKGVGETIYLAPLSTKAQTLGVALYWLLEGRSRGRCTVLAPECVTYSRETSSGVRRLWKYDIELA